jgi:serine kinase of HPr protein (carbohydrate metabolism regulator)
MEEITSIPLRQILPCEISFDSIHQSVEHTPETVLISNRETNRPGLALTGFYGSFDPTRIQLIGHAEMRYHATLSDTDLREHVRDFFAH